MFVLSQPGPAATNWPAKLNLPGGGYLRSTFAHDQLWFTSNELLARMTSGTGRVTIPLDYSISFDSNAAQYLCQLIEGRLNPVVLRFRETLRELAKRKFNWELLPFLQERSAAIMAGRDLDHIWRVVHASEYFDACDLDHFVATGGLRLQRPAEEVTAIAQRNLSEWHRVLAAGEAQRAAEAHELFHTLVLKIALLHRQRPSPRHAADNLAEFLEFMCGEVGINLPWMLWAAAGLFERGGAFEPLRKLTAKKDVLIANSRNIAWDVAHYVERRRWTRLGGHDGAFLLPYTLTFDRGLADWFDRQAMRSCLMKESGGMLQFFAEYDVEREVLDRYAAHRRLSGAVERHFTSEAAAARAERLRHHGGSVSQIVAGLEAAVAAIPD